MSQNDTIVAVVSPAPSPRDDSVAAGVKRERAEIEVNTTVSPAGSANGCSQQSTPILGPGAGPEPKKRKAAPGSRGVANLTPEQLTKKRANGTFLFFFYMFLWCSTGPGKERNTMSLTVSVILDREAQRAIRERTKLTIENLERRIRELTSQQPYQELQAVIRAKEAVEAENADIKRRLASVIGMLQPLVAPSPSEQPVPVPSSPNHSSSFLQAATTPASHGPPSSSHAAAMLTNNNATTTTTTTTAATTATTMSTPSSAASPPPSADPYGVVSNGGGGNGNSQNPWNSAAASSSSSSSTTTTMTGSVTVGMTPQQTQSYRDQLNQQRHDLAHGLELGTERLGLEFLLDQDKGVTGKTTGAGLNNNNSSRMLHNHYAPPLLGTPTHETTTTPGYNRSSSHHTNIVSPHYPHSPYAIHSPSHLVTRLDPALHNNIDPALQNAIDPALSSSSSNHPHTNGHHHHQNQQSHPTTAASSSPPQHAIPIKNCAPTCPLDNLLLDFLHERRQRAAEGFPTQEIIGPRYPSVSSLLNPLKESHPLSKVFIEILHTFPTISQLPERVATLYVMFLIMRWQIHPSADNYDRLPDFVRPSASQLCHAHPAWVDHLPFPLMRERLLRDYAPPNVFPFENFFVPFTTTLSLNWPYEDTDTLLQSPDTDELMINPVFERHLRRLENWTLGASFARAFPMLDGTYNYKADSGPAGGRAGQGGGGGTTGDGTGRRRDSSGRPVDGGNAR